MSIFQHIFHGVVNDCANEVFRCVCSGEELIVVDEMCHENIAL